MSLHDGPNAVRLRTRLPLQVEIRNAILEDLILSGQVAAGDKLPSEGELCETYAASRVTIRSALQSLQEQGYIRTVRGSGSVVLPQSQAIHSRLTRLVSFDAFAEQSGEAFSTLDAIIDECPADDPVRLQFPEDDRDAITRISRAKTRGDKRVAWIVDYVPAAIIGRDELTEEFARYGSVLDVLIARDRAQYSDCTITPVVADRELSRHLDAPRGSAVLHMSELTRDVEGGLVDCSESWFLPGAFTFYLRRNRDSH
ncbi:GntR family transcriptional regulator [Brooklawnia cerclae]|uniref:GntR family transcriptional regulator n=1 Tax=Brooklawnia cerclae TaxID=349934 RepID=A0ABX0SE94_9ACTN|nr:GntR family transcriptional regulator [Brooklawnia cerclae]NIH56717.1 GntR family transcriptional regulator [Brooklawnia cerclae]